MSDTKNEMKEINRRTFKRTAWVSGFYVAIILALFVCFLCICETKCFCVQNIFILSGIFVSVVWIVLMIIIAKLHSAAYEYYIMNPPEQQLKQQLKQQLEKQKEEKQ